MEFNLSLVICLFIETMSRKDVFSQGDLFLLCQKKNTALNAGCIKSSYDNECHCFLYCAYSYYRKNYILYYYACMYMLQYYVCIIALYNTKLDCIAIGSIAKYQ